MAADPNSATALSFLGWLDFDDADAQQMREVLSAFDDKETIDSLGLGVIRDALANQLFPGISTIQTRARYFLFVPWICQMLEAERVGPKAFDGRLRELESALIESLRATEGPNSGVIGYRARGKLERLPTSVYWNGVKVFGIRGLDLTLPDYRAVAARLGGRRSVDTDDDGVPLTTVRRMWDDTPAMPKGFPFAPASMALEENERTYLAQKIALHCPDTIIGELARDLDADRSVDTPWDLALPGATEHLRDVVTHARNFSDLMQGAQALYNLLLARRAQALLSQDTSGLEVRVLEEIADWAQRVAGRREVLRAWMKSGHFWEVVERKSQVSARTRRFVTEWAQLVLDAEVDITSDAQAASLVTDREFAIKPAKLARLSEVRALENWNGQPFSPGQMTFRWRNARRILDDIAGEAS